MQERDPNVVLVELSRNFGLHQAIITGLQYAQGDYVFLIDTDLEENPELLARFWEEMQNNNELDVVFGIQSTRKGGFFERVSGRLFYKLLRMLIRFEYPANTLTARLMKKRYVDAVLAFSEKNLDVWAIFALAGFRQKGITVEKGSKGVTTYTFLKKLKMSIEIITSLSHRPLYLIFFIGLAWLFISGTYLVFILIQKWVYGAQIEGWASIMASVWLIGGVVIFLLGVIGIYLSKIFLEIKNRPLTIVRAVYRKDR
jgi:putative glycosyltransferase